MNNLLSEGKHRFFRSLSTWIVLLLITASMIVSISIYMEFPETIKFGEYIVYNLSSTYFFVPIAIAVFLTHEYSNGTIRNKISSGHARTSIYFSNVICCSHRI